MWVSNIARVEPAGPPICSRARAVRVIARRLRSPLEGRARAYRIGTAATHQRTGVGPSHSRSQKREAMSDIGRGAEQRISSGRAEPEISSLADSVQSHFRVEAQNHDRATVLAMSGELDLASAPTLE